MSCPCEYYDYCHSWVLSRWLTAACLPTVRGRGRFWVEGTTDLSVHESSPAVRWFTVMISFSPTKPHYVAAGRPLQFNERPAGGRNESMHTIIINCSRPSSVRAVVHSGNLAIEKTCNNDMSSDVVWSSCLTSEDMCTRHYTSAGFTKSVQTILGNHVLERSIWIGPAILNYHRINNTDYGKSSPRLLRNQIESVNNNNNNCDPSRIAWDWNLRHINTRLWVQVGSSEHLGSLRPCLP